MMNAFRLAGDISHVISILLLLLRLRVTKNANGISIKTQELYLIVFVARYLDLFTTFYSFYNTIMKILYIASTSYIIYMVRNTEPFKTTYDRAQDSFLHIQFAVLPSAILGILTNLIQGFDIIEVSVIICLNVIFIIYSMPLDVLVVFNLFRSSSNHASVDSSSTLP